MSRTPETVAALAATQHGALGRSQARKLGWTYAQERAAIARGDWALATKRVLVRTGSPHTFERDAMIAMLDAGEGSALSFTTTAAVYRRPGFAPYPIHVSRPRGARSRQSTFAIVHQPTYLPDHHLVMVNGLRCTSPTRMLFDLAHMREIHPERLKRVVNNAWSDRLTSRERLARMEDEWCEQGRRGSAFMHAYLAERPVGWRPPESNLEARFIQLIVGAGMPAPVSQVNVGGDESWIGRVDCRDPELPNLLAEIDSDRFHIAPLDAASDARRDERLSRANFVVKRFREFDVWHRPNEVVAAWRAARVEARRLASRHEIRSTGAGSADEFGWAGEPVTKSALLAPDLVTGSPAWA